MITRIDGRLCVLVDIQKEAEANIVELCDRLRDHIEGTAGQRAAVAAGLHETALPPFDPADPTARARALARREGYKDYLAFELERDGIAVEVLQDQSRFISQSIQDVVWSAISGGLIAIFVIYLFLRRFKPTAILAVSIPVSLMGTFAPMFMAGIDLNIMSLGGLALGVGMLVDNSIVVLESVARRREQGDDLRTAAVHGTGQVATAVVASTLTTVAVFFPIVFVEGVAGQLFRDQALTVVFALLMSLLVALFVIPMLASRGAGGDGIHRPLVLDVEWVLGQRPRHRNAVLHGILVVLWVLGFALRTVAWIGSLGLSAAVLCCAIFHTVTQGTMIIAFCRFCKLGRNNIRRPGRQRAYDQQESPKPPDHGYLLLHFAMRVIMTMTVTKEGTSYQAECCYPSIFFVGGARSSAGDSSPIWISSIFSPRLVILPVVI